MAEPITSVVFDLGGVLIDWNPEYLYRKLIPDEKERQFFLTQVCTREWHFLHDAGVPFSENSRELLLKYAKDPHMQSLILAWGERFNEMNQNPIQGTVDILTELHDRGTPIYALTNWAAEFFPPPKGRFPFLSLFEDKIVSGVERVAKPDPKIYEILLERTKINPRRAIFVDDHRENLSPATALGFTSLLFTTPDALRKELISLNLPLKKRSAL